MSHSVFVRNDITHIKIIDDTRCPFPIGMIIAVEGGVWFEENGDVSTPDGAIPKNSYRIASDKEVESEFNFNW